MSIRATYTVFCDADHPDDGSSRCPIWTGQEDTRGEAWAWAKAGGWAKRGNQHYSPGCFERIDGEDGAP